MNKQMYDAPYTEVVIVKGTSLMEDGIGMAGGSNPPTVGPEDPDFAKQHDFGDTDDEWGTGYKPWDADLWE